MTSAKPPALPAPAAPQPSEVVAFLAMIERAARDPSVNIDKMDRLLAMRERENARVAAAEWAADMADAQAAMEPIRADADNPQTKSRYASYAALDRAVRPIYTGHGFGLTFDTDVAAAPEQVRILCDVIHTGGHTRRYHIDMPVDGKGARGGDVMTKTHAVGSGVTYGRRYLLGMIFNLAVCRDDDGNAAGGPPAGGKTLPKYVVEPPSRRLKADIAARSMQRPLGPSKPFRASEAGHLDAPPHDTIPDGPGARAAHEINRRIHPMNDDNPY